MVSKLVVDCSNGKEHLVELTAEELAQIKAQKIQSEADRLKYLVKTEQKFDVPIIAPDFIVQSPKPKADPLLAHAEAIAEAAKTDKSIALIVLDLVVYVEELEKRLQKKNI